MSDNSVNIKAQVQIAHAASGGSAAHVQLRTRVQSETRLSHATTRSKTYVEISQCLIPQTKNP